MSEKKSFWSTLPGLATGTATVITAALGVFGVLRATDNAPQQQTTGSSGSPESSDQSSNSDTSSSDDKALGRLVPESLDFGRQGIGRSSKSSTVTLTNLGTKDLTVERAELSDEDASQFEITEDRCQGKAIGPRNDCEISIRFTPKSVGDARATISVEHDGEESPNEASLIGEGVILQL